MCRCVRKRKRERATKYHGLCYMAQGSLCLLRAECVFMKVLRIGNQRIIGQMM